MSLQQVVNLDYPMESANKEFLHHSPPPPLPIPPIQQPVEYRYSPVQPPLQYQPQVLYYPPPPTEAYLGSYYYYAGHGHRQSPDAVPAPKLTPPPQPAAALCYPYSPACCCAQLHCHSPPGTEFCCPAQPLPTLMAASPMPPPPPQQQQHQPPQPPPPPQTLVPPLASTGSSNCGFATPRRPAGLGQSMKQQPSRSWTSPPPPQQQQQRRRNGYMHNILYKTELCRDMRERGACPRGRSCQFAHSPVELHDPKKHPLYKTAACYDFKNKGQCPRGEHCFHVHEAAADKDDAPLAPQAPTSTRTLLGGGSSRGAGRGNGRQRRRSPAESAEVSYRYLLKKLSSSASPAATARRRTTKAAAGAAAIDVAALEAKTQRLCLSGGRSAQ